MRLLDRSIARHYLLNVVVLFLILFAFVVVIDFSLNFDEYWKGAGTSEFSNADSGPARRALLAVLLALDLWWPRFFLMYNFLLGLVLVGGMGFTLSQMVRHRELVAVLAGGISLRRVAWPFIAVAVSLTILQAVNRELLIPRIAPLLVREKWHAGQRSLGASKVVLCSDARGRLMYAKSFEADTGLLTGLYFWERSSDGLIERRITADHAVFENGRWRLTNGKADSLNAARGSSTPIEFIETDLDPTVLRLRRFEHYAQNLSTPQIAQLIDRAKREGGGEDRVRSRIESLDQIRYGRISIMVANLLALVVCMPFFLRREPANMILQGLLCAPAAIITLMGAALGSVSAIPGLPAAVGAFVPVLVLLPLAVAAGSSIKT